MRRIFLLLFNLVTFRQNGCYNNISSVFNHHLFKSSLDLACYLTPPQNLKHPWELISSSTRNKRDVIFSHIRRYMHTFNIPEFKERGNYDIHSNTLCCLHMCIAHCAHCAMCMCNAHCACMQI